MIPVISIFEMKTASSRDELATRDGCGGGGRWPKHTAACSSFIMIFIFKASINSVCRSLETDVSLLREHTLRRTPTLQGLRPLRIALKSTDVI